MVCDLLQKIQLLQAAGTPFTPAGGKAVVETLYAIMTTRDDKGLALLQGNRV